MSVYNISLSGSGEADEVREAFGVMVRSLRAADAGRDPGGILVLDGIPYLPDEVSDAITPEDEDAEDPG